MGNYYSYGSIYIQGAPNRPLIIVKQETVNRMRNLQHVHPTIDVSALINEAIILAIEEKEASIKSLEKVGEQLLDERT